MNDQVQALIDKYKVSREQTEKIFKTLMLPELRTYNSSNDPKAVIVGGQPGAGKSQVLDIAKEEFLNNIVICNADEYRSYHPKTKEILSLHEQHYPDVTTKLAQDLNLMLRNECKLRGLNFALEITMRDGAGANATIQGIKNSGFACNVDLLAVNEKWSRLGTFERLESQRVTEKFGRVVPVEAHDDRYHAMPGAVQQIVDKKGYDNLRIFGRSLATINGRTDQVLALISNNPTDPVRELLKERNRFFTREETMLFKEQVGKVKLLMEGRHATQKEVADFMHLFLPGAFRLSAKKGLKL